MRKILIFAGTIEGRRLAFLLAEQGIAVTVCVATAYGREVLEQAGEHPLIKVQSGRLTEKQMEDLLAGDSWRAVVDATHPFAVEASKNIAQACVVQNLECLRLLRQEDPAELTPETSGAKTVYVDSAKEAVEYLNQQSGNIFLTTGSKELSDYVGILPGCVCGFCPSAQRWSVAAGWDFRESRSFVCRGRFARS